MTRVFVDSASLWILLSMSGLDGHGGDSEQVEQAKKKYTRIDFNADNINGTPIYVAEAPVMGGEIWDDKSVASEGVEAPSRKKRGRYKKRVAERDKWGNIIRTCEDSRLSI